jgi:hypothetical protein
VKLNGELLVLLLGFLRRASFWDTKNLVVCLRGFVHHLELLRSEVLGEVALVKKKKYFVEMSAQWYLTMSVDIKI